MHHWCGSTDGWSEWEGGTVRRGRAAAVPPPASRWVVGGVLKTHGGGDCWREYTLVLAAASHVSICTETRTHRKTRPVPNLDPKSAPRMSFTVIWPLQTKHHADRHLQNKTQRMFTVCAACTLALELREIPLCIWIKTLDMVAAVWFYGPSEHRLDINANTLVHFYTLSLQEH